MHSFDWGQIPPESLNARLSRKFIHGEKIMVAQLVLKQGCVVPEHSHQSEQMSLVMTGTLKFTIEGSEEVLGPGQALNIPSNAKHSVVAVEDSLVYDIFSPIRHDWISGDDSYLRKPSDPVC